MLQNPGIERLLTDLVVPRIHELFNDQALEFLQVSWNAGTLPDISYLKHYNINTEDASPFLEVLLLHGSLVLIFELSRLLTLGVSFLLG